MLTQPVAAVMNGSVLTESAAPSWHVQAAKVEYSYLLLHSSHDLCMISGLARCAYMSWCITIAALLPC
jgi:hypothetical protein